MFTLSLLNRLPDALDPIGRAIDREPDPLATHLIIAGDESTLEWLRVVALEQPGGVFAQGELLPVHRAFPRIIEGVLGRSLERWGAEQLRWPLLEVLPHWSQTEEGRPFRALFAGAQRSGRLNGRALTTLARLAEALERLLHERPEWLQAWARREQVGVEESASWWPSLWRALSPTLGSDHPAAGLFEEVEAALAAPTCALFQRYRRISYLGVRRFLPSSLRLLRALGARCPVDLYLLSPGGARAASGPQPQSARAEEARWRHPLLSELAPALQRPIDQLAGEAERRPPPPLRAPRSLLHGLQETLALDEPLAPRESPHPIDQSLSFHSAPTPLRQVEALYQAVARALREDPRLSPRSVLVRSPRLDEFAPLIPAVFNGVDGRLGAELIDPNEGDPYLELLDELITLAGSRLYRADVLAFYKQPPVLARSGATLEEALAVDRLLDEAGVRWGLDGAHWERCGLPPDERFSWRAGLDRLTLGLLVGAEPLFVGELSSLDPGEGRDALARFFTFFEQLRAAALTLQQPAPPLRWRRALLAALEGLIAPLPDEQQLYRGAFGSVLSLLEGIPSGATLDPSAVQQLLRKVRGRHRERWRGERIRFAPMSGGAVTPAPVVALLGVDEGSFPRSPSPSRFDLVAKAPPPSVVEAAEDQRGELLEVLLAAEERLIIVWSGRAPDQSPRAAAAPIEALRRYLGAWGSGADGSLEEGRRAAEAWLSRLTTEHSLHPFSPENFRASEAGIPTEETISHDALWLAGSERLQRPESWRPLEPFAGRPLESPQRELGSSLEGLASFWKNPSRAYLQRGVGFSLKGDEAEGRQREPLELDSLDEWALKSRCLELLKEEGLQRPERPVDPARLQRHLAAEGLLPPGTLGQATFDELWEEAWALHQRFESHRRGQPRRVVETELSLTAGRALRLRCDDLYGDRLLFPSLSKHLSAELLRGKNILKPWLYHLALSASDIPYEGATLIAADGDFDRFPALEQGPAQVQLGALQRRAEEGLRSPLRFDPAMALAWLSLQESPKQEKQLEKCWSGYDSLRTDHYLGEAFDQQGERVWRDPLSGSVSEEFIELASLVFAPFQEQLTGEGSL